MKYPVLASCVWIAFLVVHNCPAAFQQTLTRQDKSERTVLFPDTNATEHSLPVFPDPVVEYVGRQQPLAPPTDTYGHPLCVQKPGDTFCETVDHYPVREIRRAINYSSEEFVELFGTLAVSSRKSGDLDEDTVCPQHARLFYPKAAVNENDQWAYVVNDVDYVQTVMAEICVCMPVNIESRSAEIHWPNTVIWQSKIHFGGIVIVSSLQEKKNGKVIVLSCVHGGEEDMPCRYLDGALPSDVTSRCRQKFAYKRLLALHPNKKRPTQTPSVSRLVACAMLKSLLS